MVLILGAGFLCISVWDNSPPLVNTVPGREGPMVRQLRTVSSQNSQLYAGVQGSPIPEVYNKWAVKPVQTERTLYQDPSSFLYHTSDDPFLTHFLSFLFLPSFFLFLLPSFLNPLSVWLLGPPVSCPLRAGSAVFIVFPLGVITGDFTWRTRVFPKVYTNKTNKVAAQNCDEENGAERRRLSRMCQEGT